MNEFTLDKYFKKKKISENLTLQIIPLKNNDRIAVEFASVDRKMVVQKTFQLSFYSLNELRQFVNKIKTFQDLKDHLNIK
jgi:hypothetical protein